MPSSNDDPRAMSAHDLLVQQLLAESNIMEGEGSPELDELERLRPPSMARCGFQNCSAIVYDGPFDEEAAVEGAVVHERLAHGGRKCFITTIETRMRDGRSVAVHRERGTLDEIAAQGDA